MPLDVAFVVRGVLLVQRFPRLEVDEGLSCPVVADGSASPLVKRSWFVKEGQSLFGLKPHVFRQGSGSPFAFGFGSPSCFSVSSCILVKRGGQRCFCIPSMARFTRPPRAGNASHGYLVLVAGIPAVARFVVKGPLEAGLATHPHPLWLFCQLALFFPGSIGFGGLGSGKPGTGFPSPSSPAETFRGTRHRRRRGAGRSPRSPVNREHDVCSFPLLAGHPPKRGRSQVPEEANAQRGLLSKVATGVELKHHRAKREGSPGGTAPG